MFRAQIGGAHDIQQRVARPIELIELCAGDAVALFRAIRRAKTPGIGRADPLHARGDVPYRIRAVVGDAVALWIVRPDGVVLDVPNLMAELAEAEEPVQIEPGLAAKRTASHH